MTQNLTPTKSPHGGSERSATPRSAGPHLPPVLLLLICLLQFNCSTPRPQPPPSDPDLTLYNATARLEFDRGALPYAVNSYIKALDRAHTIDDTAAIAAAAYNLAICRAALGDHAAALTLLDEAEHELQRAGAPTADVLLTRARIALLQHDPPTAVTACQQVLNRPGAKPNDEQRLQARVVLGLAACEQGSAALAQRQLDEARPLAAKTSDPAARASVAGLAGMIHLQANDHAAAAAAFDQEADLRRAARQYRELGRALARCGRAAAAAGNQQQAADRLYRAARASAARGDADAPALAAEASTAARAAGDESLARLSAALAQRIALSATRPAGEWRTIP